MGTALPARVTLMSEEKRRTERRNFMRATLTLRQALTVVGLTLGSSAWADEIRVEPLTPPVALHRTRATTHGAPEIDRVVEASGVEPIGDGRLVLIAHDKSEELYVAESATGKIVGEPLRCDAFPKTPKWEGMARDTQGNYYLTGAHTGKTEENLKLQAQMIRFRLKGTGAPGETPLAIDPTSVKRWKLRDSLVSALGREQADAKLLKIEGLCVYTRPAGRDRPERLELAVGLRNPADQVRVFSADISRDPAAESDLAFERLFAFQAGTREGEIAQLTSLHYLPSWKAFFIVTATEDKQNAFHGNTLYYLPVDEIPTGRGLAAPHRLYDFEVAMKAEGLTDLPGPAGSDPSRTTRLLVTFDNDVHATKIPSRLQTLRLTRGSR